MKSNTETPSISVIIPVYNAYEFIDECLASVCSQTLSNIEIICINDGSNDNSKEILENYSINDRRIKLLLQENQGAGVARNRGIRESHGKYIAFMDADDSYPCNDALERLYQAAEEHGVVVAGGEFSQKYSDGSEDAPNSFINDPFLFGYCFEREGIVSYRDYQYDYGYHRFIYDREFLLNNDIFFPRFIRYQDPPFMVRALSEAGSFYALKKIVYKYRMDDKTIEWKFDKIKDLYKGLLMNLEYAEVHGYEELFQLTSRRITKEYRYTLERFLTIADELEKENETIKGSVSYKVGLFVTWLPRHIVHVVKSLYGR